MLRAVGSPHHKTAVCCQASVAQSNGSVGHSKDSVGKLEAFVGHPEDFEQIEATGQIQVPAGQIQVPAGHNLSMTPMDCPGWMSWERYLSARGGLGALSRCVPRDRRGN